MTACQYGLHREHQVRLQSASREYFLRNAQRAVFCPRECLGNLHREYPL